MSMLPPNYFGMPGGRGYYRGGWGRQGGREGRTQGGIGSETFQGGGQVWGDEVRWAAWIFNFILHMGGVCKVVADSLEVLMKAKMAETATGAEEDRVGVGELK